MNNAPRQDDIAYKKPITTTKARPNYFGLYLSFQILAIQSRSAHRVSSLTHSRTHEGHNVPMETHQELPTVLEPFCSARRRYCAALNLFGESAVSECSCSERMCAWGGEESYWLVGKWKNPSKQGLVAANRHG